MKQKILYILIMICLAGCGNRRDPRLQRIEEMCSVNPVAALDSLDAIDCVSLSDADRHYYEFLKVKVPDKAYVVHESDSLIRRVIDYESGHKECGRYAESLYYGGRVCSDLGDYPAAMGYFQEALSEVDKEPGNLDLKANIASQYGRLLSRMRLHRQAIPYIEMSLAIDRETKDTVNEVYDLHLLGMNQMYDDDCHAAENTFREALSKSKGLPKHFKSKSAMYLAELKTRMGQLDSALSYIRDVSDVKPVSRNKLIALAADIYYRAGIPDTAYMYAKELVRSNNRNNKKTGYQILLAPELRKYIENSDSLNQYIMDYRHSFEKSYDENENLMAINQQAFFNYQSHLKAKMKAQHQNKILWRYVISISFIILILIVIILALKNRNKNNRLKLHTAIANLNRLQEIISSEKVDTQKKKQDESEDGDYYGYISEDTEQLLKERLRDKLMAIYEKGDIASEIPYGITNSEAYAKLMRFIEEEKMLKEDDDLWLEIEKTVLKEKPHFKSNLKLLLGGRFSSFDYQTALLIKCGITPTQMTILFKRTKGTIASRRCSIGMRIYGKKISTQVIDGIIRLL